MQYKILGNYIRLRRQAIAKSLNEFAIDNDVDPAILSRIENLKQDIKMNVLKKIANGFSQTPAELLHDFENYLKDNN